MAARALSLSPALSPSTGRASYTSRPVPRLLSQILLATLMFPLGFMVYLSVFVAMEDFFQYDHEMRATVTAGFVTWVFVGMYWYRIWRPSVPWNARRVRATLIAAAVALAAGIVLGALGWVADEEVGTAIGSITAPLAWLAAAVVAWRETDAERAARLGKLAADSIVCPKCGYSLTGLAEARCPECGSQYTLSELLASQPGREPDQLR